MNGADLSFVHLGITIEHMRNSISIFGFRVAFYGIIIGLGMLAGMWVAMRDARLRGQDPDLYLDFAPVSYTHLDVYKRQVWIQAGRAFQA